MTEWNREKIIEDDMKNIASQIHLPLELLNNKTVLVTGANGMLAHYCCLLMLHLNKTKKANITVIALVRNEKKAKQKFSYFLGDPLFRILVQDICTPIECNTPVHYIIHAAGGASPKYIKTDPVGIISANTLGTFNVMEFARRANTERVLYTSTREVYGKLDNKSIIAENDMGVLDPLDSRSCYPESKRMSEQILKSYKMQYGTSSVIVRIAHSYGPGMDIVSDGRIMSDLICDVVNRRNIVLKSDGSALRAFCYISDAITAIFTALLRGEAGEAYNIANEKEALKIRDVAGLLTKLFPERGIKVIYQEPDHNNVYCNYKRVGLSVSKLQKLGWRPEVSLASGLKRTVLSFEE